MSDTKQAEPTAYALAPEGRDMLKAISTRLSSPRALTATNRQDLAQLIELICSRVVPINKP